MRPSLMASSLLLLGCLACGDDDGPTPVTALALEEVTTGLDFPLFLTAPAGDPRLFIVERGGLIRIVRDGAVLETPFLDVSALVSSVGEQGLLCLAFAPQYASSGTFFVSYTDAEGDLIVASYRVSSNPDVADAASAVVRLRVPHLEPTHYSGMLAFGPEGYLYVGAGDGSAPGDFATTGQDRSDLLGSILRLDVSGDAGYAVPSGNPFVGTAGVRPEIWSYGVRNPWRFGFDRTTGDLYIADVGEDQREEVNVAAAAEGGGRGLNFGWAVAEGFLCAQGGTCDRTGFTDPVLDYSHDEGCSITGGYVYRGAALTGLQGTYFFGDFCGGWVRSIRMADGQVTEDTSWPALDTGGRITSFGEDAAGELYVLTSDGRVSRIVAATSAARASRTSRSAP